jgi:hypothetical protein
MVVVYIAGLVIKIEHGNGTIVDKRIHTSCTTNSDGYTSCSDSHYATIEIDGGEEEYSVQRSNYKHLRVGEWCTFVVRGFEIFVRHASSFLCYVDE